ncbi:hypothetical protein V501_05144 [Pseudogymnoascus sp. VKM F-4519 (FW-2642)]|nr:hypothetical protein V501_05144 [Pseudogymnoascus sp. VKM F-4519 (FW-2642)]
MPSPTPSPPGSPSRLAPPSQPDEARSQIVEADSASNHSSTGENLYVAPPRASPPRSRDEDEGEDEANDDPVRSDMSTRSVTTSVFNFHRENGRTYHGYRAGSYHFPNDANEVDRLEYQHVLVNHCLQNKLFYAPIPPPPYPLAVLDIGTGTGNWAIEMGDLYPEGMIEATDLSPIQPSAVPANVQFIIDDAEQSDWAIPDNHYDFVHTRILEGCFSDMGAVIATAFKHIKPGGFLESQELNPFPHCDDGTMPDDWPFAKYVDKLQEASLEVGRELDVAPKLRGWFEAAGFVDVQQRVFKAPLGRWPKDPAMKDLGHWWAENMSVGLAAFSLAYFSRVLGWSTDEIELYLVDVRKSLMDRDVHAYHRMYVVWGRKPEVGEVVPGKAPAS